jgi:uncharacterized membrane protein
LDNPGLRSAGKWCLWLGLAGILAALKTGEMAEEAVAHSGIVHELMEEHEDWGKRAAIGFGVMAILRSWWSSKSTLGDLPVWYFAGVIVASGFLVRGAHLGGTMVYEHGTGTALAPVEAAGHDHGSHAHETEVKKNEPAKKVHVHEDGSHHEH